MENFLVKTNFDRTVINKSDSQAQSPASVDKLTFMETVEKDANKRAAERKQREVLAQDLRK